MPADSKLMIAVIDDVEQDRIQTADMAKQILQYENIPHSISLFSDGNSLLADACSDGKYHILLLDVMMNGMGGMALARLLRQQGNKTDIIFISNNREMALCGYEVFAARYLAKPLDPEKLKEALLYCHRHWGERKEILLPTNQGQHRTSFSDIQFVEAFGRGTRFVLANESVETKLKFSEAEAMLPQSVFLTCHRAYIVNVSHIKRIRPCEFEMKSGALVPISKNRYYEINKAFVARITD